MGTRLQDSPSAYLRQHAKNPVDWWPWCPEAFAEAARLNRPVLLSVGYSSCHWCHVMAHESFESPALAEVLNRGFISIKVDREERPDIDELYMTAVQLSSGRGGWPMTCLLLPDQRPFFAATYLPLRSSPGRVGMLDLAIGIEEAWQKDQAPFREAAGEFERALKMASERTPPEAKGLGLPKLAETAIAELIEEYDGLHGGFGGAPKFPPHPHFRFLLSSAVLGVKNGPQGQEMALQTLERICLGGIHDHVGGGFHRYSTDRSWKLPHFEKMLYDNAQLLSALSWGIAVADQGRERLFRRSRTRLMDWLRREMVTDVGILASAMDADSEGEEGKYYTWTRAEIVDILGERAEAFCAVYGVTEEGNFEDEATGKRTGQNVLFLTGIPGDFLDDDLAALAKARERRIRPERDDKGVAAWNGMALEGLGLAGEREFATRLAKSWNASKPLPHLFGGELEAFCDGAAWMVVGFRACGLPLPELWVRQVQSFVQPDGRVRFRSDAHEALLAEFNAPFDTVHPGHPAAAAIAIPELLPQILAAYQGWMETLPTAMTCLIGAGLDAGEVPATSWQITTERKGEAWLVTLALPEGFTVEGPVEIDGDPQGVEINSVESTSDTLQVELAHDAACLPEGFALRVQLCTKSECLPYQRVAITSESS